MRDEHEELLSTMIRLRLRKAILMVVVLGGFGLYWASIAFAWNPPLWVIIAGAAAGLFVITLVSLPQRRGGRRSELYASDAYSDLELGRSLPVPPHRDAKPTSYVGDALPTDPIATVIQTSPPLGVTRDDER